MLTTRIPVSAPGRYHLPPIDSQYLFLAPEDKKDFLGAYGAQGAINSSKESFPSTLPDPSSDLREDSSQEAPILLSLKTFSERVDLIPLKVGSSFLISRQRKVMLLVVTAMLALGGLLLTYKKKKE